MLCFKVGVEEECSHFTWTLVGLEGFRSGCGNLARAATEVDDILSLVLFNVLFSLKGDREKPHV